VRSLLSHLEWIDVVESTPDDVQCLFRPAGRDDIHFDIDQLSSGEKAAIALLLPLGHAKPTSCPPPRSGPTGWCR
jgi:hypothetical protein